MSGHKEKMKKFYDRVLGIYDSDKYESYREQEKVIENIFSENGVFAKLGRENLEQIVLLKVSVLDSFYSTNLAKFGIYEVAKHIAELEVESKIHQKIRNANPKNYDELKGIIEQIAECERKDSKKKVFYSFATKYCFHHNQNAFRIYDSFVREVLILFNNGKKNNTNFDSKKKVFYSFATKYCFHHNQNAFRIYDSFVREVLILFNNGKKNNTNFANIPSELIGTIFFGEKLIDTKLRKLENYDTFLKAIDRFAKHYGLANENTQHRRDLDHFLWILGKEQKMTKHKPITL